MENQSIKANGALSIEGKLVLAVAFDELDRETHQINARTYVVGRGDPNVFMVESCKVLGTLINILVDKQGERAVLYARMLNAIDRGFNGEDIRSQVETTSITLQEGDKDEKESGIDP